MIPGPTAPATFVFASVPRSRKAARKKDEQNKIAEDFLRSYSQTKPAVGRKSRALGGPQGIKLAGRD